MEYIIFVLACYIVILHVVSFSRKSDLEGDLRDLYWSIDFKLQKSIKFNSPLSKDDVTQIRVLIYEFYVEKKLLNLSFERFYMIIGKNINDLNKEN